MDIIFFYIFSGIAVGSAIMMIMNWNPIGSAINLIVVMVALAGLFAILDAHFIAIIQLLVYAGAIMVLFLFVIMLLNLREGYASHWVYRNYNFFLSLAGIVLGLFAVKTLVTSFIGASTTYSGVPNLAADFGTTKLVGKILYTEYLLPFEAASILLLAAIVGAVILAKSKIGIEEEENSTPKQVADDN